MATPTDAELLAACKQAIYDLLVLGKSTTLFGSESVTREDLDRLRMLRQELESSTAGDTLRNYAQLEDQL